MREPAIATVRACATALSSILLLVGCSDSHPGGDPRPDGLAQPDSRPSLIVLISLDTLRADHMGLYGHHRDTSPVLDEFAREGTVFNDASSTAPWTLPAHSSMLTGLYPREHRVLTFETTLPAEVPTLAGILSRAGYSTAAVVNSAWLAKEQYGVTRDFQQYLFVDDAQDRRAPNSWVTDQAMAWIRDRDTRPLFLFVHYYDVHSDYSSLPQYERLFVQPYPGIADGTGWQLARASFEDDFVEMCHRNYDPAKCRIGTEEKYLAVDRTVGKIFFDDDDLRHIEELYDAGIRQLDNELGRLFALMESEGAFDPALIFITSDHGEEFMDHGRMDHFLTMHQEIIRVPLIVRGPGVPAGLRIETPVSLVDLSPTILAFADVSKPPTTDGLDFTPLLRGETPTAFDDRFLFGEASGGLTYAMMMEGIYPIYRSIRRGKHKLIHNSKEDSWALYDLEVDPGETQDIAADRPDITAELSAEIRARYAGFDPNPAPSNRIELDREELERLRALGYVP